MEGDEQMKKEMQKGGKKMLSVKKDKVRDGERVRKQCTFSALVVPGS